MQPRPLVRGATLALSFCGSVVLWWLIALALNQTLRAVRYLDELQNAVTLLSVSLIESLLFNIAAYATALLFLDWPRAGQGLHAYVRCTALCALVYGATLALGLTPPFMNPYQSRD